MKQMETERIIIRRFKEEDWEDLYEYMSIPEVVFFEPYEVYSKEECYKEARYRAADKENSCFWAVCLKETNKLIGHIYFAKQDFEEIMTWELGYVFNPKYSKQGYATEGCRRILKYGFEELNAHRIVAECSDQNISSWKLLERLNMRRESHMFQNVYFKTTAEGEPMWYDSYGYAMLRREWK